MQTESSTDRLRPGLWKRVLIYALQADAIGVGLWALGRYWRRVVFGRSTATSVRVAAISRPVACGSSCDLGTRCTAWLREQAPLDLQRPATKV